MNKSFGELLAEFKQKEAPECIVPLIDDPKLRQGIVAWRSVKIVYKAGTPCMEADNLQQWEWLWAQTDVDLQMFGIVSGVKMYEAGELFQRLKGLRLIYPDGEICKLAQQFLQTLVLKEMPKRKTE